MNAIQNNAILSENIQDEIESELTFGEKIADQVAAFGGSWTFILHFSFYPDMDFCQYLVSQFQSF
jgi:uncharacterized membrane protein